MAPRALPDRAYLLERLDYDPDTGVLTWRNRPRTHFSDDRYHRQWNARYAGKTAGTLKPIGYLAVSVTTDKSTHQPYAHRVIWRMMTGMDPPATIDHINRIPTDNRWSNLRPATQAEQLRNTTVRRNATTGLKGIYYNKQTRSFQAEITLNGRKVYIGRFATAEKAHKAYVEAAKVHFGAYWSDGKRSI